ncbi:MAG: GDP-L-fucose synthase family protein [Planctomycetota bacterium]|jgi:GDP-L-fucose synthase
MNPQEILVTGASGLVGTAITNICGDAIGIGRSEYDLLQWREVNKMITLYKPKYVIHLAAKVGGVKANMGAPATFFMENLTMNTHILEAAMLNGVKKLVCALSTCVFPDPCPLPLEPKHLHTGPPHPSNYGYAYAKRMLAVQCQTYNEQYGTNFIPVIPCNIYGPNDQFNLENAHVVPALIHKFYLAKKAKRPVQIWGSGSPLREFIFSQDVAKILLLLLDKYESKEPIIISTSQEHSIKQLVEAIANAMNFPLDHIEYDTSKPEGQHRKPSANGPLMEFLGDFQFTPLEEGIEKTVRWFHDNWPGGVRI